MIAVDLFTSGSIARRWTRIADESAREVRAPVKTRNADNRHISAGIESTSTRRQTLYSTCVHARTYTIQPARAADKPPPGSPKAVSIDRSIDLASVIAVTRIEIPRSFTTARRIVNARRRLISREFAASRNRPLRSAIATATIRARGP